MLNAMNNSLARRELEYSEGNLDLASGVGAFMSRFGAIFNLNHDLFIEQRYFGENARWSYYPRKWHERPTTPGIVTLGKPGPGQKASTVLATPDLSSWDANSRGQPYFKLHGSSNWRTESGNGVLIVGGLKEQAIASHHLLVRYWKRFEELLMEQEARLMVIGYSFRDSHVKQLLLRVFAQNHGHLFVIDPRGTDVLDTRDKCLMSTTPKLFDLQPNVAGASRRGLNEIFGADHVERAKVLRFLAE